MKLTFALPTGRIYRETVDLFARAGIELGTDGLEKRRLRFESGSGDFVLGKDPDVPTYVEHGVADVGVAGRDVLEEHPADVYRPLDLGIGACRMVVAQTASERPGFYRERSVVRVATKYPRIATRHFHASGLPVDVIPLAGSVELAPLIGLADCIVDLVQTGRTLQANALIENERIFDSTAHLIVNRSSYRTKTKDVREVTIRLSHALGRDSGEQSLRAGEVEAGTT